MRRFFPVLQMNHISFPKINATFYLGLFLRLSLLPKIFHFIPLLTIKINRGKRRFDRIIANNQGSNDNNKAINSD